MEKNRNETNDNVVEGIMQNDIFVNNSLLNGAICIIKRINSFCKEMDSLDKSIKEDFKNEQESIDAQSGELINEMNNKYNEFKQSYFGVIKDKINKLVDLLCNDYIYEWQKLKIDTKEYETFSFNQNEEKLHVLISNLNELIKQINDIDFDKLVPPMHIEIKGEKFITYTGKHENVKQYGFEAKEMDYPENPKELSNLVEQIFPLCKKILACLDAMINYYDNQFNIGGFNNFVHDNASSWLEEYKTKLDNKYSKRFNELFIDENVEAIKSDFFVDLTRKGERADVNISTGTSEFNELITIGNIKLLVEQEKKHLEYIENSSSLKKYLKNGFLTAPIILDLKQCGNIFLNIDEENYSSDTIGFVNQLIIQFLLSFPANRINFCLIDIDNKVGFSQFKSLTKINNDILFKGIIRDDRQLENTIKDMEQTMYKIDDDFLSYNNVPNIFEYNKNFEANPQNIHLFVFVNYPTGMRDDIAKRLIKIIQNGNKSGIFSIIINNEACPLTPGYKQAEYEQFIESVKKSSLVINKTDNFYLEELEDVVDNIFEPKKDITLELLPSIIEILKNNAESNLQKVIPLSQMFSDTDALVASPKGIPLSARVLDIPIGARGGDIQTLCLKTTGDGSSHGVIIGGTGSGKSNLLHTIIMSSCYKYSPEDLNIYLLDLKEGVEFKYYKDNRLPHIKLLGVDLKEDLQSALAILKNLCAEVSRRGDLFKEYQISQIDQYCQDGKKLPRILVIIDEIQELFELDEKIGQEAILYLSELFKQGRGFGINILWASQNIPSAPGLKDKVLSQIGNRIALRLNEPDDAIDIKIDPKVVKNLNRPEKGLGVINDMRCGNDSIEFRVAYAEEGENRKQYSKAIIDKWKDVTDKIEIEPLFIVGGDDEISPISGNTLFAKKPSKNDIIPKAFEEYSIQLGQDYVSGKPFSIDIPLRQNKKNLLMSGGDIEVLRDMMGYSILSIILNQLTNFDWYSENSKIYYANGEMLNPNNSEDLFNLVRNDFDYMIENVSSTEKISTCIKDVYKIYKERLLDSNNTMEIKNYSPYFVVIHSIQRYSSLFNDNPLLNLNDNIDDNVNPVENVYSAEQNLKNGLNKASDLFNQSKNCIGNKIIDKGINSSNLPNKIFFSDAFKELLKNGGEVGVHFIVSVDNPFSIPMFKDVVSETFEYKILSKGLNSNMIAQLLNDYKMSDSLKNPKNALLVYQGDKYKFRMYRFENEQDFHWYKDVCVNYNMLRKDNK